MPCNRFHVSFTEVKARRSISFYIREQHSTVGFRHRETPSQSQKSGVTGAKGARGALQNQTHFAPGCLASVIILQLCTPRRLRMHANNVGATFTPCLPQPFDGWRRSPSSGRESTYPSSGDLTGDQCKVVNLPRFVFLRCWDRAGQV